MSVRRDGSGLDVRFQTAPVSQTATTVATARGYLPFQNAAIASLVGWGRHVIQDVDQSMDTSTLWTVQYVCVPVTAGMAKAAWTSVAAMAYASMTNVSAKTMTDSIQESGVTFVKSVIVLEWENLALATASALCT